MRDYIPEHMKAAHEARMTSKRDIPERVAIEGLSDLTPPPPILGLESEPGGKK